MRLLHPKKPIDLRGAWKFTIYTPRNGSWLNIAEIELSVLHQQCLDRRIPDEVTLACIIHEEYEKMRVLPN
jgi:hypothetical protein